MPKISPLELSMEWYNVAGGNQALYWDEEYIDSEVKGAYMRWWQDDGTMEQVGIYKDFSAQWTPYCKWVENWRIHELEMTRGEAFPDASNEGIAHTVPE